MRERECEKSGGGRIRVCVRERERVCEKERGWDGERERESVCKREIRGGRM